MPTRFTTLLQLCKQTLAHPQLAGICLLCRQPVQRSPLLCDYCAQSLEPLAHPCPLCAYPMPQAAHCCGRCLKLAPSWQQLRVIAHYEQPFITLIHQLKYRHQPEVATLLGQLLASEVKQGAPSSLPEAILPVPLHWWRQWRRGYNQSSLIGHTLAAELGIKLDEKILKRTRATRSQSRLDRKARRQNLRHAFSVNPHHYQHVALLDDVVTTGTTAELLSKALLQSGVQRVEVWAICRTITKAKS